MGPDGRSLFSQLEKCRLRRAVESNWVDAGQAAAYVHQRRRRVEQATGVTDAKSARAHNRADEWKSNLATMRVPSQHQIKLVCLSPGELIR